VASGEHLGSLIRFGVFEADLEARELRKHGLKIKLQDQPFRVLALLLERPGQLVTREEVKKQLWADNTFVDFEGGLNRAISRLREVLDDSGQSPRFIETLPKRGYRFLAPVERILVGTSAANSDVHAGAQLEPSPHTPPHRGRRPPAKVWLLVLAVMLIVSAAVTFFMRRPRVLTERDTVVLADFDNRTRDPVFDYTLRQALAFDLEQSPFLKIVSDQEMGDVLRLMGRNPDQRLTPDIARDLCRRTGSKAVLAGSIANLGSDYVTSLNVVNCQTGEFLGQERIRSHGKDEVLKGLDSAAANLRARLGESLNSIEKFNIPLAAVTTRSLEALQAYTNGIRIVFQGGSPASIPFIRRAIYLDANFAVAHLVLGLTYGNMGEASRATESISKAYELRDRVSEPERFWITSQYFRVTGQIEKVPPVCQAWGERYPRNWSPHNLMGSAYLRLGQSENALSEHQQACRLSKNALSIAGLTTAYIRLDRLLDAKALLEGALSQNADQLFLRQAAYVLGFLDGDATKMRDQVSWAKHKPAAESLLLSMQANTEAYFGRFHKARELSELAVESAQQSGYVERAALLEAEQAVREVEFGDAALARKNSRAAIVLSQGQEVRALVALALARAGDGLAAGRLADQLSADFPLNVLIKNYWLPTIRAEIELEGGNPRGAVEILRTTEGYELASTGPSELSGSALPLAPVYVRGEAYLRAKQGNTAAGEFQKIIQHRGFVGNSLIGALAHLGLARAFTLSGDRAAARAAYQDFFAMWKDADPEIPILKQAKAEYAKI
jgi:DNA-binding winged helix-turn-helix (wHTH) protein/tetratricopeptide (TPR) repeat protein